MAPCHSSGELIWEGGHGIHCGQPRGIEVCSSPTASHPSWLLMQSDVCTGAAHSSDYSMWRKNEYVSNGLREFAERGEAWALMKEIEAAGEKLQSVHAVFSAPAVPSGTGQTSTELEVHPRHSLVSLCWSRRGCVLGLQLLNLPLPSRCPSWYALSPALTGSWALTVWTCVRGAAGRSRWSSIFILTMQGQTAASPSPPPTLPPSHRTQ